ncbi:ATP-binding protein [Streptomyces sp. SM12]|uniref:ATP-binding protein n=1 Tax=Streptomyces sp. SM12 TaxID=1071602 RepID=UPI0015E1A598|nr:ATP-binding protein [Streptomyces sp. SM12]
MSENAIHQASSTAVLPVRPGQGLKLAIIHRRIPARADGPGHARTITRAVLTEWACERTHIDHTLTVVSELVTNGAIHGRAHRHMHLVLTLHADGAVQVAIASRSRHGGPVPPPRPPHPSEIDPLAEHGRGLAVVQALAPGARVETMHGAVRAIAIVPPAVAEAA